MRNKDLCDNKTTEGSLASQLKYFGLDSNRCDKKILLEQDDGIYARINEIIKEFDCLGKPEVHQFLKQTECDFINNIISLKDLLLTFELTLSYLFRRILMRETRSGMSHFLTKVRCHVMENKDERGYKESLFEFMLQPQAIKTNTFPSDEEFKKNLLEGKLYRKKRKKTETRYLLWKLEENSKDFDNVGDREKSDELESNVQIEHVLPQTLTSYWRCILGPKKKTLHEENLHTLGNLTLTFENNKLSNHCFDKKKEIFSKEISLSLNKYFHDLETWNIDEIKKRGDKLANMALEIWPNPYVVAERVSKL